MSRLLRSLLDAFLLVIRPAAEAPGGDAGDAGDAGGDAGAGEGDAGEEFDSGEGDAGDAGDAGDGGEAARLAAELAAEKAERAKDRERAEKFEREAEKLRVRHTPRPSNDEWEREEAILKDDKATPEQKWTVNANRELRNNRIMAQTALEQSRDGADRTSYQLLAQQKPIAKRYEAEVEKHVQQLRQNGQAVPPRESILRFLLGNDMLADKFKKKAAPSADPKQAPRGKTPGVKSDVRGSGASLTDREKRRARLENVQI